MLDITAKPVITADRTAQNLQPVTFLIIASVLNNTEILPSTFRDAFKLTSYQCVRALCIRRRPDVKLEG